MTRLLVLLALAFIVAYALRRKPDVTARREWYEPYDEAWFA